jgi:hypothetical protein
VTALTIRRSAGDLPTLYVGGGFTSIGSPATSRSGAAEVNIVDDGSVTPWNPDSSGPVYSLLSTSCSPHCSVILGGAFSRLRSASASPVTRNKAAETGRASGNPADWNPNLDRAVYGLACSRAGSTFCDAPSGTLGVAGIFGTTGGAGAPLVERRLLAFYRGCPLTAPC